MKCKVCECKFADKDELKEHWTLTEICCKTCQLCCEGASLGDGIIFPDNPEHEGHDWNVIKNKCEECVFICNLTQVLQNHMTKQHGE